MSYMHDKVIPEKNAKETWRGGIYINSPDAELMNALVKYVAGITVSSLQQERRA